METTSNKSTFKSTKSYVMKCILVCLNKAHIPSQICSFLCFSKSHQVEVVLPDSFTHEVCQFLTQFLKQVMTSHLCRIKLNVPDGLTMTLMCHHRCLLSNPHLRHLYKIKVCYNFFLNRLGFKIK